MGDKNKKAKRTWWSQFTQQERSKMMSERMKKMHAKHSPEQRRAHGIKMAQAKIKLMQS